MSDAETRSLGRVALLLLAASALRLGWAARGSPAPSGGAPDALPALLAESRGRAEEEEARSRPLGPRERLDPNRATAAELDRLPGLGPATAAALVRSREEAGPFGAPEDLLRVRGVGPKLLERIRPHLALSASNPTPRAAPAPRGARARGAPGTPAVSSRAAPVRRPPSPPAAPLDLNRADTLALQELPGVGPALARRIAETRAKAPFRTVDDLLRVRGIGPATLERLRPLVAVSR